ncbi:MAG: type II secretion system protein [Sideroxydans sp.]|nr:type II secretion system protein [Sideroxydans sp.]
MEGWQPLRAKGFTLIELLVVISIIAVLLGIFLQRVPFYQEQAEKTAMQQVEGAVQSALIFRYGALMSRGGDAPKALSILASDNPIKWLQAAPPNYQGEFYDPSASSFPTGGWVFDLKSRDLIYVLDRHDYFQPAADGQTWIRFHVHLGYEPALGRLDGSTELTQTLFAPVTPYHWMD